MAETGAAVAARRTAWVASALVVLWNLLVGWQLVGSDAAEALASVLPGTAFAVAGLVAWTRRVDNPTGRVLVLIGGLWPMSRVDAFGGAVAWTVSLALFWAWLAALVYLVLAFPGGRLRTRAERVMFKVAWVDALVVQVAWLMFLGDQPSCTTCRRRNLLGWFDNEGALAVLDLLSFALGIGVLVVVVVRTVRRWKTATPAARGVLTPVIVTGAAALVGSVVLLLVMLLDRDNRSLGAAVFAATAVLVAMVPVGFLLGLLRGRSRRARVGDLVVTLGQLPAPADIEAALRDALGDPTLAAAMWQPDEQRYARADGSELTLPTDGSATTATLVDSTGSPLAMLVHDPALLEDANLLASTTAAARLAIENAQLRQNKGAAARTRPVVDCLSQRETDILELMAAGRSNSAIADALFLSPKTVETHIGRIFGKLEMPTTPDDHRRVLAVLAFLERYGA